MSDTKPPQDPSMEEIIASISRVIAAEGGGREPVLPAGPAQDDVLELTEALDRDGGVRRIEPRAGPAGSAAPTPEGETPGPLDRIEPAASPVDAGAGSGRASQQNRDRILSEKASRAATAAFSRLGELPSGRAAAGELLVGAAGLTVEDIVREALRPLLQTWLDEHLPEIVERLVREEIARVAGAAGPR